MAYGSYYPGSEVDYDFSNSPSGSFYNDYYNTTYSDQVSRAVNSMYSGGTTNLTQQPQQSFDYAKFARNLDMDSSLSNLRKKLSPQQMPGASAEVLPSANTYDMAPLQSYGRRDSFDDFLNFLNFIRRIGPLIYGGSYGQ